MGDQFGGMTSYKYKLPKLRGSNVFNNKIPSKSNSKFSYNEEKFKVNSYNYKRTEDTQVHPLLNYFLGLTVILLGGLIFFLIKISVINFLTTPYEIAISPQDAFLSKLDEGYTFLEQEDYAQAQVTFFVLVKEYPFSPQANIGFTNALIAQCSHNGIYCEDAVIYIQHCYQSSFISETNMIEMYSKI